MLDKTYAKIKIINVENTMDRHKNSNVLCLNFG